MKITQIINPTTITSLLTAGAVLALVGCASPGYEKGAKAAANIQEAANLIGALPGRIDQTLTALNDLVQKPAADLRPQFKTFASQLADLESSAKDISTARSNMGAQGKEFFAKWDEQLATIQNEDIKARSQSRKDEVAAKLAAIKLSYSEAAGAFKPFLADLKDVQKFLAIDLTAGGVASMKDTAAKASRDAGPLKDSLSKVAADFKSLGLAMSAVTPAPGK